MKKIIVYFPEGFADWEGAFLYPELVENKVDFLFATDTGEPVSSIGRLKCTPNTSLDQISLEEIQGLILIGSDTWADPSQNHKVLNLAGLLIKKNILVAGICGATVALARAGYLQNIKHTSNDLEMLKKIVPTYTDESLYVHQNCVFDQNIITAAGIAPVDFTYEILKYYKIYSDEKLKTWYDMFKHSKMPPLSFWTQGG